MREQPYRHTKIIFTIGPATKDPHILEGLLRAGVDVCRFNMAHASHDWVRESVAMVHAACEKVGRKIALLMDIKGPEIRTGPLDEPFQLHRDGMFDFFLHPDAEPVRGEIPGVRVNYPLLGEDVKVGDTVLVDSGLVRLKVLEVNEERVRCSVRIGGELGSRRHINLPGVHVRLPALTEKDRRDIRLGCELNIDFFALSFVRSADDLDILKRHLSERQSLAQVIAKIEDQSAISNLDEIIAASDGLMVARGDLGIEIPYQTLPLVQRRAVKTCQAMGKPAIVATHMLESMIENPLPSRAEITDVANAVFEQADCVMLSGETSVGKYPEECVDVLNNIILSIEKQADRKYNTQFKLKTPKALMLRSATIFSDELKDAAILVFTRSGYLARTLSALRPLRSAIYAFTDHEPSFQNLLLYWGVEPFFMQFEEDHEETVKKAFKTLIDKGWANTGDKMVLVSNVLAEGRLVDTIQFRIIPNLNR